MPVVDRRLRENSLNAQTAAAVSVRFWLVSTCAERAFVWSGRIPRLLRQRKILIRKGFYGTDGTRTRDLRRDRCARTVSAGFI
jgi:hypothetical protein